jgi:hypothetical protein
MELADKNYYYKEKMKKDLTAFLEEMHPRRNIRG